MKSDVVPQQPIQSTTTHSSLVEFGRVARSCSGASDDENASKYLFKLSRDVILSLDSSGTILCINQRGAELSGYSESELLGSNISERLILPEDRAAIGHILQDLVQGNTREYEIRWKTKQGALVHLDGVSVPRLSEKGEFLSTLCTLRDITGRKRAEEKLRKSEEKYRDLIEISPDAIYVIDANGVCVLGNRAGAELAGLLQNELVGFPVTDTYLPNERHLFQERLKKLKSESTLRFERKFVRKNREIVPVEVSVSAIRGGYFQAIVRDISERKRAEEALRVAHENYVGLVNSLDGIVWEADAQTFAFTFVSPQAAHILGYPVARWIAEPTFWKDHIHPDDRQWATSFCMDATLAKRPHDFEYRMIAADGRTVWMHDVVTVVVENNQPVRLRGVMLDITERKQAEEALRESEERYRVLVEFSPNSICVHRNGKLLYVNPAGVRLFGATDLAELVGRSVLDFIHPDSLAAVKDRIRQVGEGETAPLIEEKFVTPNGEVRDVEVTSIPIIYERAPAAQVIIRDITERKRGEALLTGEKRLLEMIATGVELKEILNALCLIIEEQRTGTLASVLLLNSDGAHLDFVAGSSLPGEWTRQMEKLPIGPCAGSCGTAAYRRSAVIASDISTDPMWNVPEHRASALKHGLRASWSNPILSSRGKLLGTFCMYYRQPRTPTSQDLELIDLATHLVRIAIERDRAEDALRASEQLARGQVEALTYSLDVLATAPAPDKFLGQMLSTIGRLLGAQSVILWLVNEATESLVFRAAAQGVNFEAAAPEHPFAKNPLLWREDKVLQETVFTGAPVIIEDVENDPRVTAEVREYFKSSGTRKYLTIPTMVGGEVKGFIGIRHGDRPPYRPEEIELAQALAHQAMLAIQLNEFAEQSQQSAILEERNRMARDIHDTLAQGFTGVIVQLEAVEDAIGCSRRKEAHEHLRRASELARRSLNEARRSVHALRPQALQGVNFWEALKEIVKYTTAGTTLRTKFELRGKLRELPPIWQENLLRIGQEALTNALKYARPHNFDTRLTFNTRQVRLELRDDGDGFRINDQHDGMGLAGMRERVEQMGGDLKITSARGKGTKVVVTLPYNGESKS
ncbi:MAG TPA: PAS domain S-box protein [Candidatus Udaeobacter sp.]|jgi:PAS domain S-box-containing protein|nr:PAS domain S-box protein [Candidatus Udaeobacter sp.]